jgi:F-type H+-transporting ATPase subunit delta
MIEMARERTVLADSNDLSRFRIEPIHRVYARALVELASESGVLIDVAQEMEQLALVVKQVPKIILLMGAPTLDTAQRQSMLEKVFKGKLSSLFYQFLCVLNRKGQLGVVPGMILAFREVYSEQHGVLEVDAYVASPIDESQKKAIESTVSAMLGRDVAVQVYVQKELIGGLRLRVGDQLIDGTVANRLKRMKQEIIEAGRQQARLEFEKMVD